jgi:hypothetical protein
LAEAGCKELDFGCGETVQEEMGGNEVNGRILWCVGVSPDSGVGVVGADARGLRPGAAYESVQHGGTGIDGIDLYAAIG